MTKNEPIAGIVQDGVLIHKDYAPVEDCCMADMTYGEICIKCNVCGRFEDQEQPTEDEVRRRIAPHTVQQHYAIIQADLMIYGRKKMK